MTEPEWTGGRVAGPEYQGWQDIWRFPALPTLPTLEEREKYGWRLPSAEEIRGYSVSPSAGQESWIRKVSRTPQPKTPASTEPIVPRRRTPTFTGTSRFTPTTRWLTF
jgi:hypothetical protein